MSVIVPEIVIALSTLVLFATAFDVGSSRSSTFGVKIGFGYPTIIARARPVQHQPRAAAGPGPPVRDGPDARRGQLRPVRDAVADVPPDHVPAAPPGDRRGFLLSFTFSFDDYVITTFVTGRGSSTLPLYIFGQIRQGVTPETNAVAAMMLLVTLGILLVGQFLLTRQARTAGGRSGGGVAAMVAEQPARRPDRAGAVRRVGPAGRFGGPAGRSRSGGAVRRSGSSAALGTPASRARPTAFDPQHGPSDTRARAIVPNRPVQPADGPLAAPSSARSARCAISPVPFRGTDRRRLGWLVFRSGSARGDRLRHRQRRPRTRAAPPCRSAPTAGRGPAGRSGRRPRSGGRSAGAGRGPR